MDKTHTRKGRALERRLDPEREEQGLRLRAEGFGFRPGSLGCGDRICRGAGSGAEGQDLEQRGRIWSRGVHVKAAASRAFSFPLLSEF